MKKLIPLIIGNLVAIGLVIGILSSSNAKVGIDRSQFSEGEKRFYAAINHALPIIADLQKYKDAKKMGPAVERAFLFNAIRAGIKHLSNEDIDKWHFYRFKIAKSYEPYCAGILTGMMTGDIIFKGLQYLTDEELIDFANILLMGAKLYVLDRGDPETDMSFLKSAINVVLEHQDKAKADKIRRIFENPQSVGQKDQCWATLEVMYNFKHLTSTLKYRALKMLSGSI